MKSIQFWILAAICLVVSGYGNGNRHVKGTAKNLNYRASLVRHNALTNWELVADSSSKSLVNNFWNDEKGYFNQASDSTTWGGHYWPQAHALDVLVDAYVRSSGADFYKRLFEPWLTGVRTANANKWANNYIDDMEWIGLAALRAYQVTAIDGFLTVCREVWDGVTNDMEDNNAAFGIKKAWTDVGEGGIFWESRRNRHSKNACSNGPAAILAAHLYQAFGDQDDLAWAKRIYAWEKQFLFSPDSGAVYDNLNTRTGVTNKRMIFTYNQGTFIGAAVELYRITGEKMYLDDAIKAADYTLSSLINTNDNLLKSEGNGDGGLFKGIFIRYFAQLILAEGISNDTRNRYIAFLQHNGETLLHEGTNRQKTLFGPYWKTPPDGGTGLTPHLSGCMLMEALALLQKRFPDLQ